MSAHLFFPNRPRSKLWKLIDVKETRDSNYLTTETAIKLIYYFFTFSGNLQLTKLLFVCKNFTLFFSLRKILELGRVNRLHLWKLLENLGTDRNSNVTIINIIHADIFLDIEIVLQNQSWKVSQRAFNFGHFIIQNHFRRKKIQQMLSLLPSEKLPR